MSFSQQPDRSRSEEASIPSGGAIALSKRVLDICLVLASLPVLIPLAVVIGAFIRIVSPGPILFKQERIGFQGREFLCFKFRTMRVGADTSVHQGHLKRLIHSNVPMVKMDAHGDPRVIPLGSLLRSSGLDELPQLMNVFRGEMSLVGPRPCLPYEYEVYLPWQRERFNTLPGLTGLWQVSGKNRTTFVEMIQLDIDYVRRRSVPLDLKIIFRTIPALIGQMRDNRKRRKSAAPAVPAPEIVPAEAYKDPSATKPGLSGIVEARRDA